MVSFKDNTFLPAAEMRNTFNDGFIFLKTSVLGPALNYFHSVNSLNTTDNVPAIKNER